MEGILIEFKEFCNTLFQFKKASFSTAKFTKNMIDDLVDYNYSLDACKSFYNGIKPISGVKEKLIRPFKLKSAYNFFASYLDQRKIQEILDAFDIKNVAKEPFKTLCSALAYKLKEILESDDGTDRSVSYYFDIEVANKSYSSYSLISISDSDYIYEVNKRCPICGERLTELVDNQRINKYKIIKIYPDDLSERDKIIFDSVKPYNEKKYCIYNNLIAVCPKHAKEYKEKRNIEFYKILLEAKEHAKRKVLEERAIENIDVPKSIERILNHLTKYSNFDQEADLNKYTVAIKEKIQDNSQLYIDVVSKVALYCKYIDAILSKLEEETNGNATTLAEQIKAMSDRLMSINTKPAVILETIAKKLNEAYKGDDNSLISCRIIVAYFVHHCEVLSKWNYLINLLHIKKV